jgi:hypothetical protein
MVPHTLFEDEGCAKGEVAMSMQLVVQETEKE